MQIVECPRDAMQGIKEFIPTQTKVKYLNALLKVGFHTLDFGSFVSPKAIPQLADTREVLAQLALAETSTKLLAIIANQRGAIEALQHAEIGYVGYPLSISETFQQRNTNRSIADAMEDVARIQEMSIKLGKELVVYISMGFGNPYGDPYSIDIVDQFVDILMTLGVSTISLSDTIGSAEPDQIESLFSSLKKKYSNAQLGLHLHSNPATAGEKIKAALGAGCQRLDGAILGFGGCPMAEDELVGNIDTRTILSEIHACGVDLDLNMTAFKEAEKIATEEIFGKYQ